MSKGTAHIDKWKNQDGRWSVAALVFNPKKKVYIHPTLNDLTERQAEDKSLEVFEADITIEKIEKEWKLLNI